MRAALYARVSTLDQRPELQLDALRTYAHRRGWEAAEFVDHGTSGRRADRPALAALMGAARRREVDAVAITKLDRLFRSVRHLTQVAEELRELGVELVVLDQAIDTSTSAGRLLFNVLACIGEFEADLIRERTMAGIRRGRKPGPKGPRSYDRRLAARAKRLRASGHSVRQIAEKLGRTRSTVHRMLQA